MKLSQPEVERFLKQPDPRRPAALIYGPDEGLVRERALALIGAVLDDLADPFRMSELAADSLRGDPARLVDEARSLCLMGGRRVVRLRQASDQHSAPCRALLALDAIEALVVVEAGDLGKSSSLRKLFEQAGNAVAIACYRDEGRDLAQLIDRLLAELGLRADAEARSHLIEHLGGDRAVTRAELQKLALYMDAAPGGPLRPVGLAEAAAVIGDSSALGIDDLVHATALGHPDQLEHCLERLLGQGEAPVRLLRATANHFARLHRFAAQTEQGASAEQLIARAMPPIHFRRRPDTQQALRLWSSVRLRRGLARLLAAEIACKTTGRPAALLCRSTLHDLCRAAR